MDKVGVLVSSNFLKLRIEKLLPDFESVKIEYKTIHKVKVNLSSAVFSGVRLIIIDLDNYEIDSIEAIQELRKLPGHDKTPIIVLGNSGEVSVISKAIISGCSDFILKPFDDATFLERISKQMKKETHNHKALEKRMISLKQDEMTHVQQTHAPKEVQLEEHALIQWRNDYLIGIESIDAEHKQIIDHFSKLYELMRTGGGHAYYKEMLIFLKNYIVFHFENEEALQSSLNYPIIEEHKEIHAHYKAQFTELIDAHMERPASDEDLIKINLLLKNFLIQHILIEDRKIGEFSQKDESEIKV